MQSHDIGLIGLAVMGQNLVLNMARNGFRVAVYNRTETVTAEFLKGPAAGENNIAGTKSLKELVDSLKTPRRVVIMVKAGFPVDAVIDALKPHLSPGDIVIDGGNSFFKDTERRSKMMDTEKIYYLGTGISGGEEGALKGPSIMPGGPPEAYNQVEPIFQAISAKVDEEPCVTHIGPRGAGHFVKMVHNGIEYGDMQLIAESYDLLRRGLGLSASALHEVFARWNQGRLASYLIEISAEIFRVMDPDTGAPVVEVILDEAGQKGTGRWTSQVAMDLGVPTPTINAAVEARILSALRHEREAAAGVFPRRDLSAVPERNAFIGAVEDALYVAKICSYAQGMTMMRQAAKEYDYRLDCSEIARIWRGGCIIRAGFLDDIRSAFKTAPELPNLLMAPFFREAVRSRETSFRTVVETAARMGIPVPALSASLAYFDAYRSKRLPANLIQAQRDYFGAHTYRRIDREGVFHTDWTTSRE